MSTMDAAVVWSPAIGTELPIVRLTRRGRLARFVLLLILVAGLAASVASRVGGQEGGAAAAPTVARATVQVTVAQGDSLWNIAQRLAPDSDPRGVIQEIQQLNGLPGTLIHPGQVLVVPGVAPQRTAGHEAR